VYSITISCACNTKISNIFKLLWLAGDIQVLLVSNIEVNHTKRHTNAKIVNVQKKEREKPVTF